MGVSAPLPQNLDAERCVLGAMFLDSEAVLLASDALKPDDFYLNAHQEIFSAMLALGRHSQPVDLVTLAEELSRRGSLLGVGGIPYLTDLSRYTPTAANASSYIRIVEEKSTLRRLAQAGGLIREESLSAQEDAPELLERAQKRIYEISLRRNAETLLPLRPALYEAYEKIEQLVATKGTVTGVPLGFYELDKLTTGLHPGEFVLVGARPSMGKSTFVVNIAQHAALKAGKKVAIFTLETPREQVALRMVCGHARVDMQNARRGLMAEDEWMRLAQALSELAGCSVWIDDSSSLTVAQVKSRCRRLQMESGLDMVVIDYLQLMTAGRRSDNRQQEISEISRDLKILAQELHVPVLTASQLSRATQRRADNRPVLSDLRDSGAIEQDADVVMLLYRDAYYDPDTEQKNLAEIILAKQRNGPLATVELAFLGQYAMFADLPKDD